MEKMDNSDSDYRFMAMSDLQTQLKDANLKTDHDTEKRVRCITILLRQSFCRFPIAISLKSCILMLTIPKSFRTVTCATPLALSCCPQDAG